MKTRRSSLRTTGPVTRWLAITLSLLLALAMAACGGEEWDSELPTGQRQLAASSYAAKRVPGTNTQNPWPDNLQLADVDGDGKSDFVQHASNKVFVSGTDYKKKGILHRYMNSPIKQVITGRFGDAVKSTVCVTMTDGYLSCYGASTDKSKLWWWFSQGNFISANEEIIVADYDGNGRDDMLLYNKSTGKIRFKTITGSYYFTDMPNITLGNLASVARVGNQFRAGDFNGDGRYDLLVINKYRQVAKYSSVYAKGKNTFWWAWTTSGYEVKADDQVTVARINNDSKDDIAVHNKGTGVTKFYYASWYNYHLQPMGYPGTGQIKVDANSLLFWGRLHGELSEYGATNRDDAITLRLSDRLMRRADARFSKSSWAYTYWWGYDQYAPNNHKGWAKFSKKPWLVIKCKYKGTNDEPQTDAFYRDLFTSDGYENLVDYWRDISYGSWSLRGNKLNDTWYTMSVTLAEAKKLKRYQRVDKCREASGLSSSGYAGVLAIVNKPIDCGEHAGRVLADPNCLNVTFAAHETGHAFGYKHSFDDSGRIHEPAWPSQPGEYYDHWDIMSAMDVKSYNTHLGVAGGPEMNAPYKAKSSFIPAQRTKTLIPDSYYWKYATVEIAAINRPESFGALMVKIGTSSANYTAIEFRQVRDWDQGLPQDAVLVHQVKDGVSYLQNWNNPDLTKGESLSISGVASVTVQEIDVDRGTAKVTVKY